MLFESLVKLVPLFLQHRMNNNRRKVQIDYSAEYKFRKEFLEDIKAGEMSNDLKILGYRALIGDKTISWRAAEYLLSFENNETMIKHFLLGRKYLQFSSDQSLKFTYIPKFENAASRINKVDYIICFIAIQLCGSIIVTASFFMTSSYTRMLNYFPLDHSGFLWNFLTLKYSFLFILVISFLFTYLLLKQALNFVSAQIFIYCQIAVIEGADTPKAIAAGKEILNGSFGEQQAKSLLSSN